MHIVKRARRICLRCTRIRSHSTDAAIRMHTPAAAKAQPTLSDQEPEGIGAALPGMGDERDGASQASRHGEIFNI